MFDPLNDKIISEDMERIFASDNDYYSLKNKSVLITGATGMLASYIIYFLIWLNEKKDFGIQIYAEIRNKERALKRFGIYAGRQYLHMVIHDVTQPLLQEIKTDYVLHSASLASPQYYGSNPVETILPNVVGTNEIMQFALRVKASSIIFFSTNAVYGQVKDVAHIKESQVGYLDHLAPGSVYGESKRCGETICKAYFREYGVPVKIIRLSHTYGPTLDLERDKRAFSEFVKNVIRNEDIILKSDGLEKRAFCYLSDAVSMIFMVLINGQNGECYNIVNENEFVSIRQLAETLTNLFPEKKLKVICERRMDSGYVSLAQTSESVCSMEKVVALGVEPKIGIYEGFKRTILYISENMNR